MEPQWTVGRLLEKGVDSVIQDVLEGRSALPALAGKGEQQELKECLDFIGEAVTMSRAAVGRGGKEAFFQLYGRLVVHAQSHEMMKKFIENMEREAVKPWAKPGIGFLSPAGGDRLEIMHSDGHVLCAMVSDNRILMCCRGLLKLSFLRHHLQDGIVERTYLGSENVPKPWAKETTCAAIVPDGETIVTGLRDGAVAVWSGTSGALIFKSTTQHADAVQYIAISDDGRYMVSVSLEETIYVWNSCAGKVYKLRHTLVGHTGSVLCVSLIADGSRVVSGSEDGTIRVWDCDSGMAIMTLKGHTDWVSCIAVSQDGRRRIASGSYDNTVRVWDGGDAIYPALIGHTGTVQCVAISADGTRVVSGSEDNTVRVWNVESAEPMVDGKSLRGHTDWVAGVAFSRDKELIVSWSLDRTVRLWSGETGSAVSSTIAGHTTCVAASVDGRRVFSGSEDGSIRLWDGKNGIMIGEALTGHSKRIRCIAVSSHGRFIVSGSDDNTVRVWDIERGNAIALFDGFKHGVKRIGISYDCEQIVSINNMDEGCVWSVISGNSIMTSADMGWAGIIQKLEPDWSDHSELPRVKNIKEEARNGPMILGTPDTEVWRCGDWYYSFRCNSLAVCQVVR